MSIDHSGVPRVANHRVLVVTIPKSGTYLVAELLKALGCRSTGLHLSEGGYTDYRRAALDDARRNPGLFARSEALQESLTRIQAGEFAVGHLPYKADVVRATEPFRRIYLVRDLRAALISYMRFLQSTGRMGAAHLAWYPIDDLQQKSLVFLTTSGPYLLHRFYEGMAGWAHVEGILRGRFEDLMGGGDTAISVVEAVAAHLGIPPSLISQADPQSILRASLAAETITKSEATTRLENYWSPEAEQRFIEIGGRELNLRLGGASATTTSHRQSLPPHNWRAA